MAKNQGTRTRGGIEKKVSSLLFREIVPPHGWNQDENFHYLRITLPGFKQSDVTLHINKYGHLVVRGQMQTSPHKLFSFEETYNLPRNADVEEASGEFEDGGIFCITIPKKPESQTTNRKVPESFPNNDIRQPEEFEGNGKNETFEDHDDESKKKTNMWVFTVMLVILVAIFVANVSSSVKK